MRNEGDGENKDQKIRTKYDENAVRAFNLDFGPTSADENIGMPGQSVRDAMRWRLTQREELDTDDLTEESRKSKLSNSDTPTPRDLNDQAWSILDSLFKTKFHTKDKTD